MLSGRKGSGFSIGENGKHSFSIRSGAGDLKGMGSGANLIREIPHCFVFLAGAEPLKGFL